VQLGFSVVVFHFWNMYFIFETCSTETVTTGCRGGKTTRHLNNCPSAPLPPGKSLSDLLFGEELAALLHLRLFRQARFDLLNNNNNNIRNDNAAAALENENQEQQHEQEVSDSNSSSDSESSSNSGDSESERDSLDSE